MKFVFDPNTCFEEAKGIERKSFDDYAKCLAYVSTKYKVRDFYDIKFCSIDSSRGDLRIPVTARHKNIADDRFPAYIGDIAIVEESKDDVVNEIKKLTKDLGDCERLMMSQLEIIGNLVEGISQAMKEDEDEKIQ